LGRAVYYETKNNWGEVEFSSPVMICPPVFDGFL